MAKVRFNLKAATGHVLLKYRHQRGQLPFTYYTGQHCPSKFWNRSTMRAKSSKDYPEGADLNALLNRLESDTLAIHRQKLAEGQAITNEELKAALDATLHRNPPAAVPSLLEFIQRVTDQRTNDPSFAAETVASWGYFAPTLEKYQTERRQVVQLDDINLTWRDDFSRWCYSQGYSIGTVSKFLQIVKAAVNLAAARKLTQNKEVNQRRFVPKPPKSSKHALTLKEVEQIAAFDWGKVERWEGKTGASLEVVADVIVAACGLGLRHSDLCKVNAAAIRNFGKMEFVAVWMEKTAKPVEIPLLPFVKKVLAKYDYQLPTLSRAHIFTAGRMALRCVGITRTVTISDTKGGSITTATGRICDHFSAHVTRRTFATEFYLMDQSLLPAIQKILGHSTPQQTLDYMDLDGRLTAEHFARRIELNQGEGLRAVK